VRRRGPRYPRRRHRRYSKRTRRRVAVRHERMGWWGKDEMRHEMSILPLSPARTTSLPPRLSPQSSTLHHRWNVERSLTIGPRILQAHFSVRLASLARVKEENWRITDGQDEASHLNPTVRTTCGLRWPEKRGFLAAIFWRIRLYLSAPTVFDAHDRRHRKCFWHMG
jgi:hypothetical protein